MYRNYKKKRVMLSYARYCYLPLINLVPVQDVLFHIVLSNAQFRRYSTKEILVARVQRCPLRFPLFLQFLLWLTKGKVDVTALFRPVGDTQKYCYKSYCKLCQ